MEIKNRSLVYAHDPMCSWCWGFAPVYQQLIGQLPRDLEVVRLLGGLAADSEVPMAQEMRQHLQQAWRTIQQRIPGTRFNFAFWERCTPRRSTYPACRAVIAARMQGQKWDAVMTRGIQEAYYLHAKNPSDNETLITIAAEAGLDAERFATDLAATETQQQLETEIGLAQQLGVRGFPSLVLVDGATIQPITVNYHDADAMADQILDVRC